MQGILFAPHDCIKGPVELVRIWIHEANRVYRDKLVDKEDQESFDRIVRDLVHKSFEDIPEAQIFQEPLLFCHFSQGIGEPKYMPVTSAKELNKLLVDALDSYNEVKAAFMFLMFFLFLLWERWHFENIGTLCTR